MTSYLHIKLSHDTSCAHLVGRIILVPDNIADPLRIKPGHTDVAVNFETSDVLKITYHGKMMTLEKKDILIMEGD